MIFTANHLTDTDKQNSTGTHTHLFNGPSSGTTRVSRYQKGKTNLDFTETRDSEWQWHQLGHMQVCTSLQTGNHASTPPLSTVQENIDKQTQYKSEKVNNLKYSKTKLPWFSCLLQHSARKRGGLILQRSRATQAAIIQINLH